MLTVKGSHLGFKLILSLTLGRVSNLPRNLAEDWGVVAKRIRVKGVQEVGYKWARGGQFYKAGKQEK